MTCPVCAQQFVPNPIKGQKYCSKSCCNKASKVRRLTASDPIYCAICSNKLPIRTNSALRLYCSTLCAGRSELAKDRDQRRRHKKRARKRQAYRAPVSRSAIFERDGWRCQICKLKVNPRYIGRHPKAPSLDHIIPLVVGGTHEPSNVQLAHFGCNARKSSRAANDQLLLIG